MPPRRCAYGLWLLQVLGFLLLPKMMPRGWAEAVRTGPLAVRTAGEPLVWLHDMASMGNVWLLQVSPFYNNTHSFVILDRGFSFLNQEALQPHGLRLPLL